MAIASLGMYDAGAACAANDRLWAAIAADLAVAGIDAPAQLDRARPLDAIWDDPDLLLAQTCGYPLMTRWRGRLRYVATPRYRVPGCEGTRHRSRIVVRRDEPADSLRAFRGRTAAINDRFSNTGMNLLRALVAPLAIDGRFFGTVVETGSHFASAEQVASREADIAAIDAVTFAHLEREAPTLAAGLRTLAWTAAAPSLPFVTAQDASDRLVRRLRIAIGRAIEEASEAADTLFLDGIETSGVRRYGAIETFERRAIRHDYAVLR